jgi:hypothetical protein
MSRHARRCATLLTLSALVWLGRPAGAQTIGDYSRAQRAVLENTMTQAAARSAGLGASAPAMAASSVAGPTLLVSRMTLPASAPAMQVSGVFASSVDSVAEVVVNATAYVLGAGQGVPGTSWRVESVAIDRVVLSRRDVGGAAVDPDGARKVFALPALR